MAVISGYNFHCNDVGGKFGTNETATGIPISESTYTAAIPMKEGRSPYKLGDIILIKNTKNNTSALYQITDVGGLPHADIDIADGVGLEALGVKPTIGKAGGVIAVSQTDGFETQRIGHIPLKYGDKQSAQQVQNVLKNINFSDKDHPSQPISALKDIPGFEPAIAGDDATWAKNLESYAPDVKPDVLNAGANLPRRKGKNGADEYDYGEFNPDAPYRPKNEFKGYIQNMMKEDPFMGFMMMLFGILTGQFTQEDFNKQGVAPATQAAANSITPQEIQAGQAQLPQLPQRPLGPVVRDVSDAAADIGSTHGYNPPAKSFSEILQGIFSGNSGVQYAPATFESHGVPYLPRAEAASPKPSR